MILVRDDRIINTDIGFPDTHINPSDYTCKIIETLDFFNTNFNDNENKFSSAAYHDRNVAVLDKFDTDGLSILIIYLSYLVLSIYQEACFRRQNIVFILILVKENNADARIFPDVAIYSSNKLHRYYRRDFNYNPSKVSENKLLDISLDRVHAANKPTHLDL